MIRTSSRFTRLLVLLVLPGTGCAASVARDDQAQTHVSDLVTLVQNGGLRVVNRSVSPLEEPGRRGVHLTQAPGDGLAWLDGLDFSTGTITLDIRGKDLQGQSFVGIAFSGIDDETYEAVYLRPFNFRAATPLQRARSVQYIALPSYTWNRLREEQPETYESTVTPPPDPNGWVELRVEVEAAAVRVYVGPGEEPDLVVRRLADRRGGRIGLWVGNNSDGDFANLRIDSNPHGSARDPAPESSAARSGSYDSEDVEFLSRGAKLSGSIVFPSSGQIDAAVVFVHGSGRTSRAMPLARRFASHGIAALVYDKRGVGQSEGVYVQGLLGEDQLNLLADDAVAAIDFLRMHERLHRIPVGLVGVSQAGWIVPLAAAKSSTPEFLALWSGPVATLSEEDIYSQYTSDRDFRNVPPFEQVLSMREKPYVWDDSLGKDVDPVESLKRVEIPGLWVFGSDDGSIPVDLSISRLQRLQNEGQDCLGYVVFSNVGHATIDRSFVTVADWITRTAAANARSCSNSTRPTSEKLGRYVGVYRSTDPAIELSFTPQADKLIVESNGQRLELEYGGDDSFIGHDQGTGYFFLDFAPGTGRLTATQQGQTITFSRVNR